MMLVKAKLVDPRDTATGLIHRTFNRFSHDAKSLSVQPIYGEWYLFLENDEYKDQEWAIGYYWAKSGSYVVPLYRFLTSVYISGTFGPNFQSEQDIFHLYVSN